MGAFALYKWHTWLILSDTEWDYEWALVSFHVRWGIEWGYGSFNILPTRI